MTISNLHSEIRALCDTNSTGYIDADILRRINAAYEEVVGWILTADGLWQFDDTNFSTFPEATTTMVEGQSDYKFDTTHLEIEKVSILDESGKEHYIRPVERFNYGQPLSEIYSDNGRPEIYDKTGSSILIYPPPSPTVTTLAAGLKVYFKRTADIFTSAQVTTGTKEPGFASPYHVILAYMTAIPYCMTYKKDRVQIYELKVRQLKDALIEHYGKREQDRRKGLSMGSVSFR
jgi:hypothetical protein